MKDYQAIVQPIEIKARVYLNQMNDAKIENEADKENAVIMLKEISDYKKAIKKQEDELSSDAKKELAEIKAMFNEPKSFLNDAEEIVRGKINHFLNEQKARMEAEALAIKQKAEDEALKQAEELEALKSGAGEYDAVTRKAMIEAIEAKQNKLIDATAKQAEINQSSANSVVRKVWAFRLTDLSKVPLQYIQLNETAVRNAIKAGERNIAGLEIFQECQVAIK
jgi:hypothetical protein|nr:MAG TPA: hypothetical protein [Caudoviricetes sp.]